MFIRVLKFLPFLLLLGFDCFVCYAKCIPIGVISSLPDGGMGNVIDQQGRVRKQVHRDSWTDQREYFCYQEDANGNPVFEDECLPFQGLSGCTSTTSCTDSIDNKEGNQNVCTTYTSKYECSHQPSFGEELNIQNTGSEYTIVSKDIDYPSCEHNNKSNCKEYKSTEIANTEECTIQVDLADGSKGYQRVKEKELCNKYNKKYICTSVDGVYNSSCENLETKEKSGLCKKQSTSCLNEEGGKCYHEQVTYECNDIEIKLPDVVNCTTASFCLDGDCDEVNSPAMGGFLEAGAGLQLLKEAGKDLELNEDLSCVNGNARPNQQKYCSAFKGSDLKCGVKIGGKFIADCCDALKGFVKDQLKMAKCDENEKDLAMRRQKGVCIKVGEHCSEKILGVCIQHKHSHCCYKSKLARILHEQAIDKRTGLKMQTIFGDAEGFTCAPFTFEQLSNIDFTKIDFSELLADMKAKAMSKAPNPTVMQKRLSDKFAQDDPQFSQIQSKMKQKYSDYKEKAAKMQSSQEQKAKVEKIKNSEGYSSATQGGTQ